NMAARNAAVEPERRMQFRISINVGDVIWDGQRIYGDGINIAARLEALANPGGICLSDSAYRQIEGKIVLDGTDTGEQQLKNIARPVRVYAVRPGGVAPGRKFGRRRRPSTRVIAGAAICLALVVLGAGAWLVPPRLISAVATSGMAPWGGIASGRESAS